MARSKNYRDELIEALKDPKEAEAYFAAVLEECKSCDEEEAQKLLLLALKNLTEAQGGITRLAKKTGLGRESLFNIINQGKPKVEYLN